MNDYTSDRLDSILTLAATEYAKKLTDEFSSAKPDFEMSEATERRIMRMIRKDKHRTSRKNAWRIVKYIMVACLIVATVAFTACMAISRIRQAIWKAIVEWHDDCVSVQFVPNETDANDTWTSVSTDTTSDTLSTAADSPNVPLLTTIEEVNMPSYMPVGYTTTSIIMGKSFTLSYFDESGAWVFTFNQMVVDADSKGDCREGKFTETTVNGLDAIVITYDDQPNVYTLYWQDSQYRYNIYGYFEDYNELIRFVESVEVK